MAKRRTRTKRRPLKSSRRKNLKFQLGKIIGSLLLLSVTCLVAALLAYFLIPRPIESLKTRQLTAYKTPPAVANIPEKPPYEIFPQKIPPPPKSLEKLKILPRDALPMVALIIDDMGYDRRVAKRLLEIDAPITFSILPYGPFNQDIVAAARAKGHEIMLHLPMEPNEFPTVSAGPGALLIHMKSSELVAQLLEDIDQVPGLVGVNNHMGSRLSTSSEHMDQIFSVLRDKGLFYIDSRTTADTIARSSAAQQHLPFAERDIFIDHYDDPDFIRSQFERLIKRAQRQGYAVAIGHPHAYTLKALQEHLPALKKKVRLVPASMLVHTVWQDESQSTQIAHRP
jgi:polysaccharide deacetylase 2 family uncharacterized protein YibQ